MLYRVAVSVRRAAGHVGNAARVEAVAGRTGDWLRHCYAVGGRGAAAGVLVVVVGQASSLPAGSRQAGSLPHVALRGTPGCRTVARLRLGTSGLYDVSVCVVRRAVGVYADSTPLGRTVDRGAGRQGLEADHTRTVLGGVPAEQSVLLGTCATPRQPAVQLKVLEPDLCVTDDWVSNSWRAAAMAERS